ncbi:MAG: beta strand repeat-containing protein, partial [Gemmatimonadales bacterium]
MRAPHAGLALCLASLLAIVLLFPLNAGADPAAGPGAVSQTTPGALPGGTIPDGTCRARLSALGGGGGSSGLVGATFGGIGGSGARVNATYTVLPGQAYSGSVGGGGQTTNNATGGVGGTGGGGAGGNATTNHAGAGGGGRSVVDFAGTTVLVAGAGGGGGAAHQFTPIGNGGNAGTAVNPSPPVGGAAVAGANGSNGQDNPVGNTVGGGQGGQTGAGGTGGVNSNGNAALSGVAGSGSGASGTGGRGGNDPNYDAGGGGGGGYTGGGGGAATAGQSVSGAGGGGGSSWVAGVSPVAAATAPSGISGATGPASPNGAGNGSNGDLSIDWLPCLYDLTLTKTASPSPVSAGSTVTWTITVTNTGSDPMTRGDTIDLTDTLPGPTTTVTSVTTAGGSNTDLTRGPVTCTGVTVGSPMPATTNCSRAYSAVAGTPGSPSGGSRGLDPGETLTITYTQAIPSSSTCSSTLTNTATVADRPSQTGTTDIVGNTVTDTVNTPLTIDCVADLAVTKTDGATTATPGSPISYTVTVTNNGPSNVSGATVTDTVPAAITGVSWSCSITSGTGSCGAASGSGNAISTTVSLNSGAVATYTVSGTVSASASGSLVNTVTVAPPSGTTDPTPANDSATDTNTLSPQADLAVTKTDGATTATPGSPISYTVTVTNNGPSNVSGASVTDTVPAAITGVTWNCVITSGTGACGAASGSGNAISTTVDLNSGAVATYTINGTISVSATGTLANTVTVAPPSGTTDPTPANNSATDTTTLSAGTIAANNDAGSVTSAAGGQAVANVLVNDTLGGSGATTSTVTITLVGSLPSGITLDTADGSVDVAAGTAAGTYTFDYQICETAAPANCDTATVTVTVSSATNTIAANNDAGSVTSAAGGQEVSNVLVNDTLGGSGATTSTVTITPVGSLPSGITLDTADGSVDVV